MALLQAPIGTRQGTRQPGPCRRGRAGTHPQVPMSCYLPQRSQSSI